MASPWTIITHLPYESGVRIRRIDSPMGRGGNLEKSEKLKISRCQSHLPSGNLVI